MKMKNENKILNLNLNLQFWNLRTIYFLRCTDQILFVDLKFPQIHNFFPYKYKLIYKDDFWLLGQLVTFRSLKYIDAGKENIRGKILPSWIRNTVFFRSNLRICGCRLIITNLRTCDLRTGATQKFADLRLLYRISPRIYGFAIGGLKK